MQSSVQKVWFSQLIANIFIFGGASMLFLWIGAKISDWSLEVLKKICFAGWWRQRKGRCSVSWNANIWSGLPIIAPGKKWSRVFSAKTKDDTWVWFNVAYKRKYADIYTRNPSIDVLMRVKVSQLPTFPAWNTSDAEVVGEKVHSSSDRLAAPGHIHSLQEKEHQSFSESCNFDKPLSLNWLEYKVTTSWYRKDEPSGVLYNSLW